MLSLRMPANVRGVTNTARAGNICSSVQGKNNLKQLCARSAHVLVVGEEYQLRWE